MEAADLVAAGMNAQISIRTVKEAAQARVFDVLADLDIKVPPRGNSIVMCNPIRGEERPSLQIWINPGFEGAWKDHGAGIQGDIIQLVAYFKGWSPGGGQQGVSQAKRYLEHFLGLARMSPAEFSKMKADAAQQAAVKTKTAARDDEHAQRIAKAIFLHGKPLWASHGMRYVRARGIDPRAILRPPNGIRFLPSHRHLEGKCELPCIAACMQDGDGVMRAVHRTWLNRECTDKCDSIGANPTRKIYPAFTGCYIPVARGASGMAVKEASAAGIADTLLLAEGWEKSLALAAADQAPRVWAFGALANLAHVPVPDCATEIIVAADKDNGNRRAQAMLERGVDYLRTFGRPVAVVYPEIGNDVDEFLRGGDDDGERT